MNTTPPTIGQVITVHGVTCRVVKVHDFGTCDVVSLDGSLAWRVSGLGWIKAEPEQSAGHLWIDGSTELFTRCGDILRAPLSSPVMPDGYRCGRFECVDAPHHREMLRKLYATA